MANVQRSARTQTPAQRAASARRAKKVIRSGGTVYKPSPKPPQYGPTPQRARAERRERRTGVVVTPSARRYVGSPAQARDIRVGRMPTRAVTPAVQRAVARARRPARETQPGAEEFFGEARLPKSHPGQVVPEMQTSGLDRLEGLRGSPDDWLGGLIGNLGGDVTDVVTGLPSLAQIMAKGTAAVFPTTLVSRGLHEAGVPFTGWAKDIQDQALGEHVQAGKAIGEDYKRRWGPLFRGDIEEFGRQSYEHPGLLASDVAGAYSGAGVAARLAAKAGGAATGSQALTRIGSKSATTHARPPKTRTVLVGPNTKLGRKGPGVATREIPQRPYSVTNPITRGVQKVATRGGQALERHIVRRSEGLPSSRQARRGITEVPPSPTYQRLRQARFDRPTARGARDMRMAAEGEVAQGVRTDPLVRDYVDRVHALDDAGRPRPGAVKGRWSKKQVDVALDLHARDLLRVPGKTPRQALNEVIAFKRQGLDEMVGGGGIKTKGAIEELETLASLPDELLDLRAGASELRPAVEAYRSLSRSATERRVAAETLSPEAAAETPSRAARMVHAGLRYDKKTKSWVEEPRMAGGAVATRQEVPGLVAEPAHAKAGALRSPLDPYADVGSEAVYVKDIPAIRMGRGATRQVERQFGRITQDKDYASHGVLFRGGITQADRGLPIKALERALADELHPRFVQDIYETFAFRRTTGKHKGEYVRDKKAISLMEADPDSVVLLGEKSLKDAMARTRDLPEGEMPDSPLDGVDIFEGTKQIEAAKAYRGKGRNKNQLIAFPKSAVDGIRNGWENVLGGNKQGLRQFDTAQQLWKRGILAFAPRWYLNSLFGNTFMYGMATGGDISAIVKAIRHRSLDKLGPEYEARVRGSTNVAEARLSDPTAMRGSAAGNAYRRVTDHLMGKQASFDALFRRALYINRMRKQLRREGVKTRGLSPDDLAEAFRSAPKKLQDQALRDVELFLGDYLRLSAPERGFLRRIFPFYSWMRVIGRFMLEVPIRHPKRTAILAATTRAAAEVVNPLDPGQNILANRGRVMVGGLAARTAGANPLFTHADIVKGAAGLDIQGLTSGVAANLSPIGLQQLARNYGGTTAFGAPVSFPPGYQGAVSSFGMPPMRIDPVTGQPDYFTPTVPLEEQALQTIPLLPGLVRGLASGGREPYDVTRTSQLIANTLGRGEGNQDLLFEPERGRAMTPIPYLGPALSIGGANLQRYNRAEDIKAIRKRQRNYREAQRQTKVRKRKARR